MAHLEETKDAVADSSENEKKEDGSDEEEEEFEIEAVLDAKKGHFERGKIGYLVKWKGYGNEHNSWVKEEDAQNASDLINEFWEKRKKARKSVGDKPKDSPAKKSTASPVPESVSAAGAKRGRGRPAKTASAVLDEEDEEGDDDTTRKRRRTSGGVSSAARAENGTTRSGRKKTLATIDKDSDGDVSMANGGSDQEEPYHTMKKYMSEKNWENLVKSVRTVERVDEELFVFFDLTTGEHVREKSSLCAKRFPQKLIRFYESNLRWRVAENTVA